MLMAVNWVPRHSWISRRVVAIAEDALASGCLFCCQCPRAVGVASAGVFSGTIGRAYFIAYGRQLRLTGPNPGF